MTQPRMGGLRLRLGAGLLGAGLVTMALFVIVLLIEVRDSLYARRLADARERLEAVALVIDQRCPPRGPGLDQPCRTETAAVLGLAGFATDSTGCEAKVVRQGDFALLCADTPGGASLTLRLPLGPVERQLRALDARLLVAVAAALLVFVLLAGFILERGVVRRLQRVDDALLRVGAAEPEQVDLLAEGGDALGQLGAAVNRLAEQLRAERARTREQIVTLQEANRLLADEKRALREAREDLVRSERLALVGRLAAGVAHEVGNPLSAVIAYAAILKERLGKLQGAEPSVELSERIEREALRVDRILRDLLDLARPREVRLEALELAQVLARARALLEPQPRWKDAGCALVLDLPPSLPCVKGEEHYVVQVLVNVLLNAAKAGARSVRAGAQEEGERVVLTIADDGRGISADDLPRLFEPFFTSAAPGDGTGLGLALCHATMERLGGSIAARAGVEHGAVFELRFLRA